MEEALILAHGEPMVILHRRIVVFMIIGRFPAGADRFAFSKALLRASSSSRPSIPES
jgi:hypothetical protein